MTNNETQSCVWLLDTRPLWQGIKIADAAPDAMSLLSTEEQNKARAFYFLRDAKLSMGSSLLKRHFVSRFLNVPWSQIHFTRFGDPKHGKPCYITEGAKEPLADFNVTHQAGVVALAGTCVPGVQIGIDVVCVNERNERKQVEKEGFEAWVDIHRDVFSDEDLDNMKYASNGTNDVGAAADDTNTKLRRFFAYWALKEAYVKLEGEALLASWLRDVTFCNVRVPRIGRRGESTRLDGIEVWIKGIRREDVVMTLESYEEEYMIATALKRASGSSEFLHLPDLKLLDLDDILPHASE